MNRHTRRAAAATDKKPGAATIVTLGGRDYEFGRFNIGELKRMTEIIERSDHAVDRSKLLLAIALERIAPELKIDDEFETDMAELDAAATTVINLAGFVMLGKQRAAAATA
jgi:hypothetical protein